MTIELKIDTKALETLFSDPDMKLKLQQGVIEEFTRRHIKEAFKAVENIVNVQKAVDAAGEKAEANFITKAKGTWGNTYELRPEFAKTLKGRIEELTTQVVNESIANEMERINKYIEFTIRKRVQEEIDVVSTKVITEQVQKKMTSVREMLDNMTKMA